MGEELAASESQTEFRTYDNRIPRQRQYYDVSMFQDNVDPELLSVETPSRPFSNSQYFAKPTRFQDDNRGVANIRYQEPKTPVRLPAKQLQQSSSSDGFDMGSSPSAMPPPSRRGHQTPRPYRAVQSSQYARAPRDNPLNALLKKPSQAQPQFETMGELELDPDQAFMPTQHNKTNSPRQALSLPHAPLMAQGIPLVPINRLPVKYHSVFPYKVFNATQSKCFDTVFNTSENLVLSSPTGSGKTVVMELAICRLMETFEPGTFKIIYQAPTKALCAERKRDWEKKFSILGLKCTELTGDTQFNQLAEVKNGDLIVTTPEKWDSITRRWTDHKKLLGLVRLFLIDEVHILKEDRGATLEVVVSRMKTIGSRVRFVALSATVPNSKDIATWLAKDCDNPSVPAHEERLGEEFRPVKLEKIVYGYQANLNDFVFDKFLDQKLYDAIQKHSQRKPAMVFCATRNICVSTARLLAEKWNGGARDRPWPAPLTNFSLRDKDLQATAKAGVAFHHAGLDASDRVLIEKLFLEGHISVICCTSTLAVGVNLPAHLVVIKNTVSWQGCQMREYLDLEVMQMVGRAGRPQFDTTGVAVIMTRKEKKERYERMISGTEKLESCLHLNLIEHLNAEIGLGTITDLESAKQWLRSTFLYIRMKSNPAFYKFKAENIEAGLENIMEKDIACLEEEGFVEYQQTKLKCLEPGDAMARYYIKFETMKNIMNLKEKAKAFEILACISEASEFKEFRIRSGEKAALKEINSSPSMKWPVKVDISSPAHKANILIQFEIGCMDFPTTGGLQKYRATLLQDKSLIFQHLHRLIRCICDIKLFLRDSVSCRNSLELARCIEAKVWENSPSMLLQLDGLGIVGVRKFVNNDIKTIERLDALEAHKIEMIVSRNPPYGAKLKQDIAGIPRFRLFTQVVKAQGNRRDPVKVTFRAEIGVLNDQTPARWHGKLLHLYFLVERSDGFLVDFRRMPILKLASNKDFMVQAEVTEPEQTLTCHIACEEIVNTSRSVEVVLDIPDSQFPQATKEGPMSAFLRKRSNMKAQVQNNDPIDLTGPQNSIVNKPFKPPTRENSKVSKADSDEFGDAEFERDLRDLGIVEDSIIDQTSVPIQVPWTPINKPQPVQNEQMFSINHAPDDEIHTAIGNEELDENSEPKQRPDGKWDCNHRCADKSSCRHLCCREGLDHKPKPKRKLPPKANPTKLESTQTTLTAKCLDGTGNPKISQKQGAKELPKTKLAHTAPRKRVSDLVSAARSSTVPVVDLSHDDDELPFIGNGAPSVRKLKELHSKCQTNKSIKLPKLSKTTLPYGAGEKFQSCIKKTVSDEIEDLLADNDDDFPTVSEIMEEAGSKRKEKKETYGSADSLLGSLDAYAVEGLGEITQNDDEISLYEILENTPLRENMKKKRKLAESKTLEKAAYSLGNETRLTILKSAGRNIETQEISSDTLPSSPPHLKKSSQKKLIPLIPPNPPKKARLDDTKLHDISMKPSSKLSMNAFFHKIPSEFNLGDSDKDSHENKMATPDTSVCSQLKLSEEKKENVLEQEIMDFLGDCVYFVD
ncbi:hypothetical protein ABW20_dc0109455 [Dactylellina cionopaga]|nr:hypothetical protein ABW20_dc0109455 [Dactylellina cionopaga]